MKYSKFIAFLMCFFILSCGFKKVDQRTLPDTAKAKARKNINEGRGTSIAGMLKDRGGNTNYEFSTSNPMWRASLETLDFLPLTTVDYSGGMIVTDWYTDATSAEEAIKISVRFLSNDVRSESLKVIVHKKTCLSNQNCTIALLTESKIKEKLHSTILRKAASLEKQSKEKK
jgi:hypothetical protein